jgi:hypothetical protein
MASNSSDCAAVGCAMRNLEVRMTPLNAASAPETQKTNPTMERVGTPESRAATKFPPA